jgi:uncharacterized protein YbjT (DUF2867 family)
VTEVMIAVFGAGGRVGGQVLESLRPRAAVRAITRRPVPVADGVDVAVADMTDLPAVERAVDGAAVAVLITADVPDRVVHQANVPQACARRGSVTS